MHFMEAIYNLCTVCDNNLAPVSFPVKKDYPDLFKGKYWIKVLRESKMMCS